ncbi:RNA-binding protein [Ramlibacter sp. USB13]|uniref:Dual-specificity RNA pseudouridine synthase RluF n=1 Tax=Ramlibacter cellulosilyticus TaxID=2764187 RepID=A0A923MNG1_9BURK|nr:RNA-binding protein [Ramlibacter cellulosilyticus]
MADEPQRLSKVVAALAKCSRREAEQYIAEGWVRVDGRCVEEPFFRVAATQRVEVDPQARLQRPVRATYLWHKPAGVRNEEALAQLGPATHWAGDASGIRYAKGHGTGLQLLMPLPMEAAGLSVFSQDDGIVRKLTEDAALLEQELVAEVAGTAAPDALARLGRGLVPAKELPPARVSWQSETRLRLAAKGIAADRVPALCAEAGLQLVSLRRIRIGRVPMAALPAGQWRYLPTGERF